MYYKEKLGLLMEHDPNLRKPFKSIFPAATYNLGSRTVCAPHLDFTNLPFELSVIIAMGDYDPKMMRHLILWECGLIVEFPPGSTVLIPSAIITHSNSPIQL